MRNLTLSPFPELQEAGLRDCPQRSCSAVSPFALPRRAGARLLQALFSLLIKTLGQPIERAPADVHRAFHRGASVVLVSSTAKTDWKISCTW